MANIAKIYQGGQWVAIDVGDLDSVDGIQFRINAGKLQYSTDGATWYDAS